MVMGPAEGGSPVGGGNRARLVSQASGRTGPSRATTPLRFRPPNRGTPPRTGGAASRGTGACIATQEPLRVLAPSNNPRQTVYGQTAQPLPTLLVYVPPSSAKTLELQLNASESKMLFRKSFAVPKTPGLVRLDLTGADLPPMALNRPYLWYVRLLCNGRQPTNPISQGWIERVAPSATVAQAMASASPQSLPLIYAEAGLWYEAVASLDALRRSVNAPTPTATGAMAISAPAKPAAGSSPGTPPQPHQASWTSLLQSVGLEAYAQVPLADCCTFQP
jgi:hypothetical protein